MRAWRYLRLALHLLVGVLTLLLAVPFCTRPTLLDLRRRWSRRLLDILGLRLQLQGAAIEPGTMLVANHISWVDIFVINAVAPSAFVSKAEVRNWPVIGWLSARSDTIFLRRGSRGHARIINAEIAALLDAGDNVAIFPEGTTTDGSHVLHFHAALLQPAIACGHAVQPLALSYRRPDGSYSRAPAYDGELTLGQCLANIVAERETVACVSAAPPVETRDGIDRRSLAHAARATIMRGIGCADDEQG
ncbi:lysophospholipid acyltransferase family protein [Thauera sp.]|uniref:lysophospholipid acyltransferase family protein n=1 Tax=Thauera sp. TaxID=1905334 RepID=UPI0039E556A7